jgi:hypothetical protein
MPLIQGSASLAANTTIDNVLSGSQFEFLPYNARLDFAVNGSAAGMVTDIYSGQDVLCEALSVNSANRFPIRPDDFLLTDVAAGGERIKIRIRNTTGGALTYFFACNIQPL